MKITGADHTNWRVKDLERSFSVEWEDAGMDRVHGGRESASFVREMGFEPSVAAFDATVGREQ